MKPTYVQAVIEENDKLKLEIAELRQALTGRTVSCHACNQSAMERDMLRENIHEALEEIKELTKERDEARAMMVTLCHKVVAAALSEEKEDGK
jgi:regulator of replication initiation timing